MRRGKRGGKKEKKKFVHNTENPSFTTSARTPRKIKKKEGKTLMGQERERERKERVISVAP